MFCGFVGGPCGRNYGHTTTRLRRCLAGSGGRCADSGCVLSSAHFVCVVAAVRVVGGSWLNVGEMQDVSGGLHRVKARVALFLSGFGWWRPSKLGSVVCRQYGFEWDRRRQHPKAVRSDWCFCCGLTGCLAASSLAGRPDGMTATHRRRLRRCSSGWRDGRNDGHTPTTAAAVFVRLSRTSRGQGVRCVLRRLCGGSAGGWWVVAECRS